MMTNSRENSKRIHPSNHSRPTKTPLLEFLPISATITASQEQIEIRARSEEIISIFQELVENSDDSKIPQVLRTLGSAVTSRLINSSPLKNILNEE